MDREPSGQSIPLETIGTAVEIHAEFERSPGQIRHALLDFDGTISLLRAGWQDVMTAQFVHVLSQARTRETEDELADVCESFITDLTGRQTIYQMLQLEEEVVKRGGEPRPAAAYKSEYLELLNERIASRIGDARALRARQRTPIAYLVPGAVELLEGLQHAGICCYLASGTDIEFVLEEAEMLGVSDYFRDRDGELHIYGALEDYRSFSKMMIVDRILTENALSGPELVVFGDGYVELENARAVGGLAVGVASLETGGPGWDPWKRERLREVGAQVLVPDWQECGVLLDYLGVR